jgi:hypothetical protein
MRRPPSGQVLPNGVLNGRPRGRHPQRALPRGQLFTALVVATVTCGMVALLALDPGLGAAAGRLHLTGASGLLGAAPAPLAFPIWWHAPFFSQSGGRRAAAAGGGGRDPSGRRRWAHGPPRVAEGRNPLLPVEPAGCGPFPPFSQNPSRPRHRGHHNPHGARVDAADAPGGHVRVFLAGAGRAAALSLWARPLPASLRRPRSRRSPHARAPAAPLSHAAGCRTPATAPTKRWSTRCRPPCSSCWRRGGTPRRRAWVDYG